MAFSLTGFAIVLISSAEHLDQKPPTDQVLPAHLSTPIQAIVAGFVWQATSAPYDQHPGTFTMPSLRSISVALRAVSYLQLPQVAGHIRRRARDRLVPLRATSFLASLRADADQLAPTLPNAGEAAAQAAATVATFFAAKHTKNVPQCFEGRFTFLNRTHDFGTPDGIDWSINLDSGNHQLWRSNLAFMGYLCTACDTDPSRGLMLAAKLADNMMAMSTFTVRDRFADVWNSYAVAQRILALSALLIRLPPELAIHPDRGVVDHFLRFNVAYLLRNLETELGYNHLERNLSALALYALATQAMPAKIEQALHAHFAHIVGESIADDGVQLERSPMYQGFVVQSLRVLGALDIWSPTQSALLAKRQCQVDAALAALTLGDDRPAMFNDGWLDETPVTSAILGNYDPPGFVNMPDAGYVRLAQGQAVALFDAGAIGADANPGHGHSDFLAIELSLGANRFIVDPGTLTYSAGAVRDNARSWNAHNGPTVIGIEPVEYLGSFKVGRRVAARLEDAGIDGEVQFARGALNFAGIGVRRAIKLSEGSLSVQDNWQGTSKPCQSAFLIPPDWRVAIVSDCEVHFSNQSTRVRCLAVAGTLAMSQGQFSLRYNLAETAHTLVAHPDSDELRLTFDWEF